MKPTIKERTAIHNKIRNIIAQRKQQIKTIEQGIILPLRDDIKHLEDSIKGVISYKQAVNHAIQISKRHQEIFTGLGEK